MAAIQCIPIDESSLRPILVELNSPSMLSEASLSDLLGSHFLDLVQFLLHKLDSVCLSKLQTKYAKNKQHALVEMCNIIGLQFAEKSSQRLTFLQELLDLCYLKCISISEQSGSLDAKLQATRSLLSHVAEQQQNIFASPELFPADMQPLLKQYKSSGNANNAALEALQQELQQLTALVTELRAKTLEFDEAVSSSTIKQGVEAIASMQAALSEKFLHLKSILQRFSDYFQQDFLPWAPSNNEQQDSSKTGFTQLGQHAAELLQNAKQLDEVFMTLEQARLNYLALESGSTSAAAVDLELASIKAREATKILRLAIERMS